MTTKRDDRSACLDFVVREQPFVVRFLLRLGISAADAEDAAQEATIQAWRLAESGFWGDVHEPRGWIRKVALRHLNRPRGRRRGVLEIPTVDIPEPRAASVEGPELSAETVSIVATLSGLPRQEGIAVALRMDGLTSAETGAFLGVSNQRARDLLKRARKRLRRQFAAQAGDNDGRTS
ncbi:RNA polymerase sigma factor [Embleya sp. NPDC008237]|uniref:RNA polymerase sigma factor n=1 Tax=Embleya sp. NPDC008237 TaxID=3363978 RepID=UPI0036E02360